VIFIKIYDYIRPQFLDLQQQQQQQQKNGRSREMTSSKSMYCLVLLNWNILDTWHRPVSVKEREISEADPASVNKWE